MRRAAVDGLRNLVHWEGRNIATLFLAALRDEDEEVRWSAVLGLKATGIRDQDVLSALTERLEDPASRVRTAARSALEALRRAP